LFVELCTVFSACMLHWYVKSSLKSIASEWMSEYRCFSVSTIVQCHYIYIYVCIHNYIDYLSLLWFCYIYCLYMCIYVRLNVCVYCLYIIYICMYVSVRVCLELCRNYCGYFRANLPFYLVLYGRRLLCQLWYCAECVIWTSVLSRPGRFVTWAIMSPGSSRFISWAVTLPVMLPGPGSYVTWRRDRCVTLVR